MRKNKLRNRQKTLMSTKMRVVVASSIFVAASMLLIVVFNLGEVKDSRAFSSGDYRSLSDGDWSEAASWEVFDGEEWSEASMPPGTGVKKVVVSNNSHVRISDEIVISNLVIDEGSRLSIDANVLRISKMKDEGKLVCNGILDMGTSVIEGNADLVVNKTATLFIGSDAGIDKKFVSGNIQLKGKKEFSKDAIYVFNGTVKQHTGNGLPSVMRHLVFDNSSGVDLDQSFFIVDKLVLSKGVVSTGKYNIALGASPNDPGIIERNSGFVMGRLKRWYGPKNVASIDFPMSDLNSSCLFSFTSDIPQFQTGLIELFYHEGVPDGSGLSPFEVRHVVVGICQSGYYTAFLSNGPDEAYLKMTSAETNSSNENEISWMITQNSKQNHVQASKSKVEGGKVMKTENFMNILSGPNPFQDMFVVRFSSETETHVNIQVMNNSGQVVYTENRNVVPGYNLFKYQDENELPAGVYIIRISNPSEIHTLKMIKISEQSALLP